MGYMLYFNFAADPYPQPRLAVADILARTHEQEREDWQSPERKDRIESADLSIEFLDQFRKFHGIFSKFCKFSGIFDEFGHF